MGTKQFDLLKQWADDQDPRLGRLALVISDIEMAKMDGYTFATEIRADKRLKHLYVILYTSMSGVFNQSMVDNVGADKFIAKFDTDMFTQTVINVMKELKKSGNNDRQNCHPRLPLLPYFAAINHQKIYKLLKFH